MRHYSLIAVAVCLLLTACANVSQDNLSPGTTTSHDQNRNSYLRVDGSRLVTAGGREIQLRGINIGGWLVTEAWMCGFTDSKDTLQTNGSAGTVGRSTLESLEERFGAEPAAALMRVWQDHWITTSDLDQIRDGGFNLIRVPISYRTLQHADGSWILDAQGQIDFARMDWIVREAAQRGIYTIFDLHIWPQQRLAYEKIGRADGAEIREAMARLWTVIAAHYRGNGAIAAFDLINEFPGNWGVQQVLSRAVRSGDPDRVQVIEGFTFAEFLKLREAGEFPNSIFSTHMYGAKPLTTEELQSRLKETIASPVPVYIGEFLAEDFTTATQLFGASKANWSSWTYKVVDMGDWGAVNYFSDLKTDIQNDTFEAIQAKWSTELSLHKTSGVPHNYFINEKRRIATASAHKAPLP